MRARRCSADLIRNDPFLEDRPLTVSLYALTPQAVAVLKQTRRVRFIDRQLLTDLGLSTQRFDYEGSVSHLFERSR